MLRAPSSATQAIFVGCTTRISGFEGPGVADGKRAEKSGGSMGRPPFSSSKGRAVNRRATSRNGD